MKRPEGPPNRRVRMGITGRDISDDLWPSKLTVVGLVVLVLIVPVVIVVMLVLRHWLRM